MVPKFKPGNRIQYKGKELIVQKSEHKAYFFIDKDGCRTWYLIEDVDLTGDFMNDSKYYTPKFESAIVRWGLGIIVLYVVYLLFFMQF